MVRYAPNLPYFFSVCVFFLNVIFARIVHSRHTASVNVRAHLDLVKKLSVTSLFRE